MRTNFLCDVGDFGKFGLLRFLVGQRARDERGPVRLGFHWYWRDEPGAVNQRAFAYLHGARTEAGRLCDPDLYDALRRLHQTRAEGDAPLRRRVERSGLLPPDTLYYTPTLGATDRAIWHEKALEALAPTHLVFLDPDNGVGQGARHALADEIRDFVEADKVVVVIHHFGRTGSYDQQLSALRDTVPELGASAQRRVLHFQNAFLQGGNYRRAYLLLARAEAPAWAVVDARLEELVHPMLEPGWGQVFSLL